MLAALATPFCFGFAFKALTGGQAMAQNGPVTYVNYGEPILFGSDTMRSSRIHELILDPDSTFQFWSRPLNSCSTWHHIEGMWRTKIDTLIFTDQYEVEERNVSVTYRHNAKPSYFLRFKTDWPAALRNKTVKLGFIYDYNAHLADVERTGSLSADQRLEIPFKSIPDHDQLATIMVEYQLDNGQKRHGYLTENETINIRKGRIPNVIDIEFVEAPKKETVYRTIKAIRDEDCLVIVFITKTAGTLPDYHRPLEFEANYTRRK